MSKEAEEYLKRENLIYKGIVLSKNGWQDISTPKTKTIPEVMQSFADQQIKERLNSVTDDDIANKAEMRPDDLDNVKSFNAGYRTGAKWLLNLLKKK